MSKINLQRNRTLVLSERGGGDYEPICALIFKSVRRVSLPLPCPTPDLRSANNRTPLSRSRIRQPKDHPQAVSLDCDNVQIHCAIVQDSKSHKFQSPLRHVHIHVLGYNGPIRLTPGHKRSWEGPSQCCREELDKLVTEPFFKHAEKLQRPISFRSVRILYASGRQPVTDGPGYISDRLGSLV